MLSEIEVTTIVSEVAETLRKTPKNKPWEFYPVYHKKCELAEDIAVHATSDIFPERIFKEKAPNEDPALYHWRKKNYRPVTRPFWQRAVNITNRVWNEQNYSIVFEAVEDELQTDTPMEYFTSEYPEYGSIINYFRQIVSKVKLQDANAVMTVKPKYLPTKQTETEAGIITEYDTTVMIEPCCYIYNAKDVIRWDEGRYTMVMLSEKSEVEVGLKKVKEGLVFEVYDTDNIYRVEQYGKKHEYNFNTYIYYTHNLGYLPAWIMKGEPTFEGEYVVYKSPYAAAIPVLDMALFLYSTLMASTVTGAFPVWWEVVDYCRADGCVNGEVNDYDELNNLIGTKACGICRGTGKAQRRSPFATYEVQPANAAAGLEQAPIPPLGYVALDPAILKFLRDEYDTSCNQFLDMLNIDTTKDKANPDTATGKALDREELFSFLLQFGSEVFDLLGKAIKAAGTMRYGDIFTMPSIRPPSNFSIRSEGDLVADLKVANESNLPRQYKEKVNREAIGVRFPNDEEQTEIYDLVVFTDSLFNLDKDYIAIGIGNGTIEKWEAILNRYILMFIEEKEMDENWDELEKTEKRDILIQMAKDKVTSGSPFVAEKMIV